MRILIEKNKLIVWENNQKQIFKLNKNYYTTEDKLNILTIFIQSIEQYRKVSEKEPEWKTHEQHTIDAKKGLEEKKQQNETPKPKRQYTKRKVKTA